MKDEIFDKLKDAFGEAIDDDPEEAFMLISLAFVRMSESFFKQQGRNSNEALDIFVEGVGRKITLHKSEQPTVH